MSTEIIEEISKNLSVEIKQVESVLKLLEEGNTIPFIARYRKEATGNLNEEQIKVIEENYTYQVNLLKRKEDVIRLIDEKGMLTDELKEEIMACTKLVEVEDLYRPYKEKKKTKATEAIKNGLEPLAKYIMTFPVKGNIEEEAKKYLNDKVLTPQDAIQGASYIIAENISDNAKYRKAIRDNTYKFGTLITKLKKNAKDEDKIYDMYYDYQEQVRKVKPHRILAINRGEKEGILSVSIENDTDRTIEFLNKKEIKNEKSIVVDIVKEAIKDAYKRLIQPSIENPGYINGCKLAVIDKTGKYLDSTVIKPFLNGSNKDKFIEQSKTIVKNLIDKYNVDIIAIGNGTASRESEKFCSELIHEYKLNCKYVIVSEAGASIYSASKIAIEEFPDLAVPRRNRSRIIST